MDTLRRTGRLPVRYGLASTQSGGQSVFTCTSSLGMPANETTLAELLSRAGYTTHMVGKVRTDGVVVALPSFEAALVGGTTHHGIAEENMHG